MAEAKPIKVNQLVLKNMIKKIVNKIKEDYKDFISARKRVEELNCINKKHKEYIQLLEDAQTRRIVRSLEIIQANLDELIEILSSK